jgi:thioredoxin reductase (NADPH)
LGCIAAVGVSDAGGRVELNLAYAFYLAPMAAILFFHMRSRKGEQARSLQVKALAMEAGLTEPASLHPVIDPAKCMGCGSCIAACPEGQILGLIDNKAQLIEPTQCIGHGACKTACPFDAISLVFGTETRGVELPIVGSDFQSNVPGLYIAGELGGMGLIRNAIEQGVQAMEHIRSKRTARAADMLDVLIVGAGPAGFAASLSAMEHRLSFATIEQDTLGGTVAHFPRGKLVMTQPALLPLIGMVKFRETTKEELLEFWTGVQVKTGLDIQFQERVESVTPLEGGGFQVRTTSRSYRTQAVLLAIGRRGTPRKLDVPGEELSKVVYRLDDPEQYRGQHVLVVGGGDSAIEAAASIAEVPGTVVTLSYRSDTFQRSKLKNRKRIEGLARTGQVNIVFNSSVKSIAADSVIVATKTERRTLSNDAVIVCAGGILPNKFLEACGISVETKYGTE